MGIAWKAYDETAERFVVLKFVPKAIQHVVEAMHSVRESFKKVHALQHQHICPLYGLFNDPQYGLYIVMKFVDGLPLDIYRRKYVEKHGPISFDDIVQILWAVAKGLDYAHDRNVIHRDIKPQNIMIGRTDGVQIIDFGLAEEIRSLRQDESVSKISGTRSYMAPEQWEGKVQDARTDQYALAVTAYELLSGRVPFYSKDSETLRNQVLHDPVEPIPGQSESVNAALFRALSKKREDRYENCKAFVRALAINSDKNSGSIILPVDRLADDVSQPTWLPPASLSSSSTAISKTVKRKKIVPVMILVSILFFTVLAGFLWWSKTFNETETVLERPPEPPMTEIVPTRISTPVVPIVRVSLELDTDGKGRLSMKKGTSTDPPDAFHGVVFPSTAFPKAQTFRGENGLGRMLFDFRDADPEETWAKSDWKTWRWGGKPNEKNGSLQFVSGYVEENSGISIGKGGLPYSVSVDLVDNVGPLPNVSLNLHMKNRTRASVHAWGMSKPDGSLAPGGGFSSSVRNQRRAFVPDHTTTPPGETFFTEFQIPKEIAEDVDFVEPSVWINLRPVTAKSSSFELILLDVTGRFGGSVGLTFLDQGKLPTIRTASLDGPAYRAGLRDGDQIVRWNGQKVSVEMIRKLANSVNFGDPVEAEPKSSGKEKGWTSGFSRSDGKSRLKETRLISNFFFFICLATSSPLVK